MATGTFHDANRALENLQQETTGAREITKFEKAQIIIARAGELLQHTIELAEEIDIITRAQQRREEPKQQDRGHPKLQLKQFPVQREKQRQTLMRQLKDAKKEMRQIQCTALLYKMNQFENKKDNKRKRQVTEHSQDMATSAQEEEDEEEKEERSKGKEHGSEQEEPNSEDENTLESKQVAQSSVVKAQTKDIRGRVKRAMKTLHLTQKQLSIKLNISPAKVSQWMTNKKMADPELILAQMISFLEKVENTIRERTNIGTSKEHAEYGRRNNTDGARRSH
jgi:hypothetical protein